MLRYGILLMIAMFTDGLQAFASASIFGVAAGATASTLGAAGPIALPAASSLSFVIDITSSLTFGIGLISLLAYNGMFYFNYITGGAITEMMPGIDVLPAWTVMTILCIIRKESEKGNLGSIGTVALKLAGGVTGIGAISAAASVVSQAPSRPEQPVQLATAPEEQKPRGRTVPELKTIDGVRPPQAASYAA